MRKDTETLLVIGAIGAVGYLVWKSGKGIADTVGGVGGAVVQGSQGLAQGGVGVGSAVGEIAQGLSAPFGYMDKAFEELPTFEDIKDFGQSVYYEQQIAMYKRMYEELQQQKVRTLEEQKQEIEAAKVGALTAAAQIAPEVLQSGSYKLPIPIMGLKEIKIPQYLIDEYNKIMGQQSSQGGKVESKEIKYPSSISVKGVEIQTPPAPYKRTSISGGSRTTTQRTTAQYKVGQDVGGGWILTKKG